MQLGTRISRQSRLARESTSPSFWPMSTPNRSGMLKGLQPAEPRIVSPPLRMPLLLSILTIHFYIISFHLGPLLLLLSSFLRLRTSPRFHQQKCPPHFESPPTRQPLAQVVFPTLYGSRSIRPMSGSFHPFSLPSPPTGTTP